MSYFNSEAEIEYSWKFIDELKKINHSPFIYNVGGSGPEEANELLRKDGREWV